MLLNIVTSLATKINGYIAQWRGIPSLRSLNNGQLRRFWESVDIAVTELMDAMISHPNIDEQYPLVAGAVRELLLLGEFVRVEALAQALFTAAEKENHSTAMIRSQIFLGYGYFSLFEFENSRQAYLRGLAMLGDTPEDLVRRVVFLSNLSIAAVDTEDLDQAASYGKKALRLLNTTSAEVFNRAAAVSGTPPYHIQRSTVMSNLGYLYQEMGVIAEQGAEKQRLLERAARYNLRSSRGRLPLSERIRSEANFGSAIMYLGRVEEAYALFKRLIRRCGSDPAMNRLKGWIYGFMSQCAVLLGAPDQAMRHCHTSMQMAIRSADPFSENEIMQMALAPLKNIYSDLFKGEITGHHFLDKGMPVILELLDFLEDKDWYTARDHSRGVARIALTLYDVLMNTDPTMIAGPERKTLEIASLLHDIGKLWIPWGILNRVTPLWKRDFDIIKRHPDRGREFMESLGFKSIGAIVGRHHERPDGNGYPHGGDIGGIAERILAVADSFEAMTTRNRLYRKPMTPETAVRKMIQLSGRQFDDTVVHALPDALDRLNRSPTSAN